MTASVRDMLAAFDGLSPAEQQQVAAELLRRSVAAGDLPEAALHELAAELFRGYDAEEARRADEIPVGQVGLMIQEVEGRKHPEIG